MVGYLHLGRKMRLRMMKKNIAFISAFTLLSCYFLHAQGLTTLPASPESDAIHFAAQWPDWLLSNRLPQSKRPPSPGIPLPQPTAHFAFFCRLELKIEKITKFPVKFRLGDLDYVDRLEGKKP